MLARLFTLALAAVALPLAPARAEERPNIVVLYADDMGYGDLAAQNPESKIPTPHLDRLAREGVRFTDGHSSSGICTPSRYALLTGRYHWRRLHGIVNSFEPPVIEPQRLTLPEMLKERGYTTACIGKWHLGWDWKAIRTAPGNAPDSFDWSRAIPGGPLDHGFDYYFGDDVPNFPPYAWIENDRVVAPPTVPLKITPKTAEGNWEARPGPMVDGWDFHAVMPTLTEKAVDFIAKQKGADKPFFLYFPWTSPHAPIVPTERFVGSSKAGGYGDFMHESDWAAGQVLRALDDHGLTDSTIVIFSSDNGPEHYARERIKRFDHRSMGPLRGMKRDVFEGGHRVPFLVRWPGKIEAGRVSDALVSQIDFYATIAAIVGHELRDGAAEDSHDLLPLLLGKTDTSPRRSLVHNTFAGQYAVRRGDWVLVDVKEGGLFNLADDLAQKIDRTDEEPEIADQLRALLKQTQRRGEVRTLPNP